MPSPTDPNAGGPPTPPPDQGGAPPAAAGAPPFQGPNAGGATGDTGGAPPGDEIERLLTTMRTICDQLRQVPMLTAGLTTACQGLQQAHTAYRMNRPNVNVAPAPPV